MVWEENSRICLHMQLIAILSRIGVVLKSQTQNQDSFPDVLMLHKWYLRQPCLPCRQTNYNTTLWHTFLLVGCADRYDVVLLLVDFRCLGGEGCGCVGAGDSDNLCWWDK